MLEVGCCMLDVKLSKGYNKHEKQYCFFNSRRGFAAPGIEKVSAAKGCRNFSISIKSKPYSGFEFSSSVILNLGEINIIIKPATINGIERTCPVFKPAIVINSSP